MFTRLFFMLVGLLPKKVYNNFMRRFWRRKVRKGAVAIADIQLALQDMGLNRAAKRKFWRWFVRNPESCWEFLARHYQ